MTLDIVRETAKAYEDSARQAKAIENHVQSNDGDRYQRVQFVKKKTVSSNSSKPTVTCYSCGIEVHVRSDPSCPAHGQKWQKCSNTGHFEKMFAHLPRRFVGNRIGDAERL